MLSIDRSLDDLRAAKIGDLIVGVFESARIESVMLADRRRPCGRISAGVALNSAPGVTSVAERRQTRIVDLRQIAARPNMRIFGSTCCGEEVSGCPGNSALPPVCSRA